MGAEKFFETDNYVDYKIAKDRFLRIRLLHPDKAEHILGADLIYEQYDVDTEKVRIAVLQYKTWENGVLYFSQGSIFPYRDSNARLNGLSGRNIIKLLQEKFFSETPPGIKGIFKHFMKISESSKRRNRKNLYFGNKFLHRCTHSII